MATIPQQELDMRGALKDAVAMLEDFFQQFPYAELDDDERRVMKMRAALHTEDFQSRVDHWLHECFSAKVCADKIERNHRFLEEAIELVQSEGCTASEAHQLVDYVFGRPVGEPSQECGGVMVTLAALCLANKLDMVECGESELVRIWSKIEQIRRKQAGKPKHSPLPQAVDEKLKAIHEGRNREEFDAEDARSAATEAMWKERQGDDYGSY